jgi:hypothetical protein
LFLEHVDVALQLYAQIAIIYPNFKEYVSEEEIQIAKAPELVRFKV